MTRKNRQSFKDDRIELIYAKTQLQAYRKSKRESMKIDEIITGVERISKKLPSGAYAYHVYWRKSKMLKRKKF